MNQENQEVIGQNEVQYQENIATNAVADSDISVAEQTTGYVAATPEEAEQIARDAVIAAVNGTAEQAYGGEYRTPQEAELQATRAVAETDYTS